MTCISDEQQKLIAHSCKIGGMGIINPMCNANKEYVNSRELINEAFHDGGPYHIENSPLICYANQWTGFYMIGTSVMKELIEKYNNTARIQIHSI